MIVIIVVALTLYESYVHVHVQYIWYGHFLCARFLEEDTLPADRLFAVIPDFPTSDCRTFADADLSSSARYTTALTVSAVHSPRTFPRMAPYAGVRGHAYRNQVELR